MPKRPLTAAEKAAYRELAKAAAKLRTAQQRADEAFRAAQRPKKARRRGESR
jgi:hypothetical protein